MRNVGSKVTVGREYSEILLRHLYRHLMNSLQIRCGEYADSLRRIVRLIAHDNNPLPAMFSGVATYVQYNMATETISCARIIA